MVQFRLCGEDGCVLCAMVGRKVRTPATSNNALRQYALSFVNLPVPNPMDQDHYLSPADTETHVINKNLSHEALKDFLPDLTKGDGEARRLKDDKEEDKEYSKMYKRTKVRGIVVCGNCAAPRCVYSNYEPGSTIGKGPKKKHMERLDQYNEDGGYMCGADIPISILRAQKKHRCNAPVESQYYCDGSKRGGRVSTDDVCCLCYTNTNLAPRAEVLKRQSQAVNNPLPVCFDCLSLNIKLPGGGTNFRKKKAQKKAEKTALKEKAVASGRKKRRVDS